MILKIHKTGMTLCDSTESLIDRWLPEPATDASKASEKKDQQGKETIVLYRAISLPFRIPARTIHIISFKVDGITQELIVKAKWAVQLTKDQKEKLSAYIAENSRKLMDKVSNSTAVVTLKNGKTTAAKKLEVARKSLAEGQRAIAVKCHTVADRVGIIELRDITIEKIEQLQVIAISGAKSASNGAYVITQRVAGNERATFIFTKIGEKVPLVKSAVFPEASTGSSPRPPAPARLKAATGDSGSFANISEVMSEAVEKPVAVLKRAAESVETDLAATEIID
jgi:hypothetical protein